MADVLSGDVSLRTGRDDLTVVLLNRDETTALTNLLDAVSMMARLPRSVSKKVKLKENFPELDELTNMLLALAKDDAIAEMRFIERNQCDDDD
jgi:hypothetical protein